MKIDISVTNRRNGDLLLAQMLTQLLQYFCDVIAMYVWLSAHS